MDGSILIIFQTTLKRRFIFTENNKILRYQIFQDYTILSTFKHFKNTTNLLRIIQELTFEIHNMKINIIFISITYYHNTKENKNFIMKSKKIIEFIDAYITPAVK